jgi:hypothetical protein
MKSIEIEQGRIFIEGIETSNPTHIGYAIIDLVQEGKEIIIKNPCKNKCKKSKNCQK